MNLIIGILGRPKTIERDITSFSKAITDIIISYGYIPLGIIPPVMDVNESMGEADKRKLYKIIDLCDGIILQGGTDYYSYDLEAIKYIVEKNIPILGICLGMQSMGVAFGGTMGTVVNHNQPGMNYVHDVNIDKQSYLYKIISLNKIMVNSRHNDIITCPLLINVVGCYGDVIEAIEKEDVLFCIGVQWHPEDMIKYDESSRRIFEALFQACQTSHEKRKLL